MQNLSTKRCAPIFHTLFNIAGRGHNSFRNEANLCGGASSRRNVHLDYSLTRIVAGLSSPPPCNLLAIGRPVLMIYEPPGTSSKQTAVSRRYSGILPVMDAAKLNGKFEPTGAVFEPNCHGRSRKTMSIITGGRIVVTKPPGGPFYPG